MMKPRCSCHYRSTVLMLAVLWWQPLSSDAADGPQESGATPTFYAFCFDTHDARKRDLEEQAVMLARLGFDGAGHVGLEQLGQRKATLNEAGLKLYLAGVHVDLRQEEAVAAAQLNEVLPVLGESGAVLYVVLAGLSTADPAGDQLAVSVLRQLAGIAEPSNIRLGIYPHTADWVARVEHAVEVAHQVDRKNVGVIFNLCHWLRNEEPESLEPVLRAAGDRLFGVTINGADLAGRNDRDWSRLIQPLNQGDFDLARLLELLDQIGYDGPIGLMCYGIAGDAAEHLRHSIDAWRDMVTP